MADKKKQRSDKEYSSLMLRLTDEQRDMLKAIANDMELDLTNTMRFMIKREFKKIRDIEPPEHKPED